MGAVHEAMSLLVSYQKAVMQTWLTYHDKNCLSSPPGPLR